MRVDADGPERAIYEVFLDGEKLTRCFMADDELGCVEVQVEGAVVGHPELPRGVETRMRWGAVEIRPAPGHEADAERLLREGPRCHEYERNREGFRAAGFGVVERHVSIDRMAVQFGVHFSLEQFRRMGEEEAKEAAYETAAALRVLIQRAWKEAQP